MSGKRKRVSLNVKERLNICGELDKGMEKVLEAMSLAMKKVEEFAMVEQVERTEGQSLHKPSGLSEVASSGTSSKKVSGIATSSDHPELPKKKASDLEAESNSWVVTEAGPDGQFLKYQIPPKVATLIGFPSTISIPRATTSTSQSHLRASSVLRRRLAAAFERCPRMNYGQRLDIATWAADNEEQRLQDAMKREVATGGLLRAQIEALGIRLTEIKNFLFRLNSKYVTAGVPADKYIRDVRQTVMYYHSVNESIRLKSATLLRYRKRVLAELADKRARSESLRPVDIENLKIENEQLLRAIDITTIHLNKLKNQAGHAAQKVNSNKKRLAELKKNLQEIQKVILSKKNHIASMEQEEQAARMQAKNAERELNHIRERLVKFTSPDVFEYIVQKSELRELVKEMNKRKRKINVLSATSMHLHQQIKIRESLSDGHRRSTSARRRSTDQTSVLSDAFLRLPVRKSYAPHKSLARLCLSKPKIVPPEPCKKE